MELLNLSFALLILKITFCVLPGVFGIVLIVSSEDAKRRIRNKVCRRLFGVSGAIRTHKFSRFLYFVGTLLLFFSITAGWFLIVGNLKG